MANSDASSAPGARVTWARQKARHAIRMEFKPAKRVVRDARIGLEAEVEDGRRAGREVSEFMFEPKNALDCLQVGSRRKSYQM